METPANLIEELFEQAETYGKTTIELSKLRALEATGKVLASLISKLAIAVMFAFFALVLNLGIALFLGEWLGKIYYGFFVVAAFYLIAGVVFHFFLHGWIKKPVLNEIFND